LKVQETDRLGIPVCDFVPVLKNEAVKMTKHFQEMKK